MEGKLFRADRMQKERERKRVSRCVMSELCGLTPGAIRRYERGERIPSISALVAIADYLECSTDYLLGRDRR